MDTKDFQERYFESLDAVQALLELITKREEEVNSLYVRVESLEKELEKRQPPTLNQTEMHQSATMAPPLWFCWSIRYQGCGLF